MIKAHYFNFTGGKELRQMGATWFVSYAYYKNIDKNHNAWMNIKTVKTRINGYNKTQIYHAFWLKKILLMDNKRLNTNSLNIDAETTKTMAIRILQKISKST